MKDRRQFLREGSSALGALMTVNAIGATSLFSISCARREAGAAFVNLSDAEAADLEAVAEQIIPATDTPGAREAGVIYFIDTAVTEGMPFAGMLPFLKDGVKELAGKLQSSGSTAMRFADAEHDVQISLLTEMEPTPFFGMVSTLTKIGFFADPKYGGNKDKVGWELIGFDDRHAWQPPFGYYDGQLMAEERDES
ncbi:MAG: gluconate 2-dehydrogenase subunit 3 family protein [Rhodothermales bacterium]|nr:gluconate 2-dehydrogenase subunit 3 family protein [Rhodothermales bacterium]